MQAMTLFVLLEETIHRHAYTPVRDASGGLLYYSGRKKCPEVHLKRLLILSNERGCDICDKNVFDAIVAVALEDVYQGLKDVRHKERMKYRLHNFAAKFWEFLQSDLIG